ncbi:LD-carboxypeptidase [Listeria sp. PSOL-1]|uniref:LD-carboxypeptidase n=1 Tax=Listeria sp. PSOL-1 TaxID=1844999 RepID=UPI0013D11DBA|nr:LD-carboxypeptidase [Listeria sp. PSOL-1]
MKILPGSKIGIIACSDGCNISKSTKFHQMKVLLESKFNIEIIQANTLYASSTSPFSGPAKKRAQELMSFYQDEEIAAIFDVSGGNAANQILNYLDFDIIKKNPKPFVGYSDLTTILNAIYQKTGNQGYNFLLQNIVCSQKSLNNFKQVFIDDEKIPLHGKWLIGKYLGSSILLGGNIRCLLKLAGTKYFPDFTNKILLLESLSGLETSIATFIAQYEQIGVFSLCDAVVIGQFTEAKKNGKQEIIHRMFKDIGERYQIPVLQTTQVGHSSDSIPVPIGSTAIFS